MSITLTLWLTLWKTPVRSLWILMLMHKWIASTLRYATVWALVLKILYNKCTYTLICIWTLTGGFICWILKHYLLIPDDDISSDLDLSGCNINTDNGEKEELYTKFIGIMFLKIQLDHKLQYEQREIININVLGRLYPFKISVSPRNKSTLFQQDTTWTCGPYTVVKVGLFRQFFDYILMRAFHLVASVLIRGMSMKTG